MTNKNQEQKTCKNCKKKIDADANFCPHCTANQEKKKWYQQSWFIILMLILVFPAGVILMWLYADNWKKWLKVTITVIAVISIFSSMGSSSSSTKKTTSSPTPTPAPITEDSSDKQSISTPAPTSIPSPTTTPQPSSIPTPTETEAVGIDINWDKAINLTKSDIIDLSPPNTIKSTTVDIDNVKRIITFTVVVADTTSTTEALDLADTALRRLNSNAQLQDSSIKASTKNSYGGIFDTYTVNIGIAPAKYASNSDEWFVNQVIPRGRFESLYLLKSPSGYR